MRADSDVNAFLLGRTRAIARAAAVLLLAGLLSVSVSAQVGAEPRDGLRAAGVPAATSGRLQEGGNLEAGNASEVSRQSVHGVPALDTIARLLNFAILVGVLVYFLRSPIANYLARRSTEIRSDLVTAAETRQAAEEELAAIEQKMKALPGEIEALKARGAAEIAAEEARIRQAADTERARLLEQARREIELHLRAAERELVKRAAELTIGLASDRIKRTITDEDQRRLVDQYLAQIRR